MSKIRLMLVDDSLFFRTFLTTRLQKEPTFEIVGSFADPVEALNKVTVTRPDVIVVDMEMPKMRGNEFIRQLLPKHPRVKALVVSALSGNVFDAMQAGAIDFIAKPGSRSGFDEAQFIQELIQLIKVAAVAHTKEELAKARPQAPARPGAPPSRISSLSKASTKSIIAIGASTGGTEAILEVIKNFPAQTPGTVIVQHMPPVFTKMYAERCDKACNMTVKEAQHGDRVEQGKILIAPGGDQQMYVRQDAKGYYINLIAGAKVSGHCPSVDVMFDSVAKIAGRNAVGVLLTGMGADGAQGLLTLKRSGAHTIGQDEASCVVYGMPMEAFKMGAVTEQLSLTAICDAVLKKFR